MTSSVNRHKDTPLSQELVEILNKIRETDKELYENITLPQEDVNFSERRCLRWGVDPQTGRRFCIEWG